MGNVPRLRFPGFEGEWEKRSLGDFAERVMYGMNSSAIAYDGENKYLRITDIDDDTRSFIPNPLTSPDGLIEEKYKLKKGDIVFTRTGASVGKSYLYDEKDGNLFFAGFLIKFSLIKANPYFVYSQSLKESYDRWVKLMSMRSGQPGINAEEYKTLAIFSTGIKEQEKIANFLTTVDDRLNGLKKKKALLEKYKKGMMQKIFNREVRFKDEDGGDFGEWENITLRAIGTFFSGGTPSTSKPEYYAGDIPFIKSGEINKSTTAQYISESALKSSSANMVRKGDLLYALYGATSGEVAISKIDGAINQAILCIRFRGEARYLHNYLLLQKESILSTYLQGGQGNLSADIIKALCVPLPSVQEQTKIANFLTAVDDKIDLVAQEIEKMEVWKKGLLGEMFV